MSQIIWQRENEDKGRDLRWKLEYADDGTGIYLCTCDEDGGVDLYVLKITDVGLYSVVLGNPWMEEDDDREEVWIRGMEHLQ